MKCPTCGTALPGSAEACTTCGAPVGRPADAPRALEPAPPMAALDPHVAPAPLDDDLEPWYPAEDGEEAREAEPVRPKRRSRLVLLLVAIVFVLLGVIAVLASVYLPAYTTRTPAAGVVSQQFEPAPVSDAEHKAVESVVSAFYDALNAKKYDTLASMVTTDTTRSVTPKALKKWRYNTFEIVRSAVTSEVAYVYGFEGVRAFSGKDLGVKFTLHRSGDGWLVKSWQAVDEGTVSGAVPTGDGSLALSDASARDIISTLLQARQQGDAAVIQLLTTPGFQAAHAPWLDGVDNSLTFTSFQITKTRKVGRTFRVLVREQWGGRVDVATYTVVLRDDTILVDKASVK